MGPRQTAFPAASPRHTLRGMTAPLAPGHWVADPRGDGRGVRVSAHVEAGFLVLSTWKAGVCVSTVRLLPDEAAALVGRVAQALAELAPPLQGDDRDL
jgi:hypothetical protein